MGLKWRGENGGGDLYMDVSKPKPIPSREPYITLFSKDSKDAVVKQQKHAQEDEDDELKFQVMQCSKSQGMEFLTEDYQDEKKTKEQFIKNMLSNLPDAERQLIESTFGTNKEMELDESKVDKLVQYGYPKDYILTSLQNNEANYLTAGYYLLKMDQNY